eukprot:1065831-Pelagomonas_calceolata.AAC.3
MYGTLQGFAIPHGRQLLSSDKHLPLLFAYCSDQPCSLTLLPEWHENLKWSQKLHLFSFHISLALLPDWHEKPWRSAWYFIRLRGTRPEPLPHESVAGSSAPTHGRCWAAGTQQPHVL